MEFNRRVRSSNVQGFARKVLTLYEEEEYCAPLHGYRRTVFFFADVFQKN